MESRSVASATNFDVPPDQTIGVDLTRSLPEPRPSPAAPRFRWERAFLLIALPVGLLAVLFVPPLQELDGVAHLLRIDGLAHGQVVVDRNNLGQAVVTPSPCLHGFITGNTQRGWAQPALSPRGNVASYPCSRGRPVDISNTALAPPVGYLPQTVGYGAGRLLGGVTTGYYGARLFGLATYLLVVWWALRLAPRGHAVLYVVACLPSSLVLASVLSADGFTLALALLAVALILRLRSPETPELLRTRHRDLAVLAVSVLALALAKNVFGLFALLAFLIPVEVFRGRRPRRRYVGGLVAGSLGLMVAWTVLVASRVRIYVPAMGIDSRASRAFAKHHPVAFGASLVRSLWDPWVAKHTLPGYVEVLGQFRPAFVHQPYPIGDQAPLWLFAAAVLLIGGAVVHSVRSAAPTADSASVAPGVAGAGTHDRRRWRAVAVAVLAGGAMVVMIFAGIRLTATTPAARSTGWVQGRYFLPLTLLLAVVATAWRPGDRRVRRWEVLIPVASCVLIAWVVWRGIVIFY